MRRGKVFIVGAGPGDPELISVKGLKALKKADCVLYDFLSAPQLLEEVKSSCEKVCVGKADGLHLKEQGQINRLLYEKALIYKNVVRLKGGDPFIFSRGFEEASYLSNKGVDHEVIPGITSAISGPESAGIPLTIKNKIQSVAILTGRKEDINASIDAPSCATLIYLMAVANIANVVKALRKSGRSNNTPCAFIERATHKDSRIIRATIKTIEKKVKEHKIKPPAVLVVGQVVKEAKRIKNNGKKI
jgi:uroporphyrin-III C-methyltransferase